MKLNSCNLLAVQYVHCPFLLHIRILLRFIRGKGDTLCRARWSHFLAVIILQRWKKSWGVPVLLEKGLITERRFPISGEKETKTWLSILRMRVLFQLLRCSAVLMYVHWRSLIHNHRYIALTSQHLPCYSLFSSRYSFLAFLTTSWISVLAG